MRSSNTTEEAAVKVMADALDDSGSGWTRLSRAEGNARIAYSALMEAGFVVDYRMDVPE